MESKLEDVTMAEEQAKVPQEKENAMYLLDTVTRQEVPLKSIVFTGDVYASRFSRLTMRQEYVNESETDPIETVFYFPVDIGYGLNKLRMELYDLNDLDAEPGVVETVVEEKQKAEEKFEDAVVEGQSMPVMAKYTGKRSMRKISFHLGNFPPRSKAVLTCFMSAELEREAGYHVFRLPLTYVPQYVIE